MKFVSLACVALLVGDAFAMKLNTAQQIRQPNIDAYLQSLTLLNLADPDSTKPINGTKPSDFVDQILKDLDSNGDGKIQQSEFKAFV